MGFSDQQKKSLSSKLKHCFVKTRNVQGAQLSYVEGWHVIAEANRIFGYDAWDRRTLAPRCVWADQSARGQTSVLYTTTVRVSVRAGEGLIMREGVGTGFGRSNSPQDAHEMALKAAETDATKRALATFGNPFGLALYDKERSGVTRSVHSRAAEADNDTRPETARPSRGEYILCSPDGSQQSAATAEEFQRLARTVITDLTSLETLYAFWDENKATLKRMKASPPPVAAVVAELIEVLKSKARSLGSAPKIDKPRPSEVQTALPLVRSIPKEKRLRNKLHLDKVRQQPCLVCGRAPSHAHHVRYAQQGALGLKVSDEFTVPLCSLHHDAIHRTGNEKSWWIGQGIDPLRTAHELWVKTLHGNGEDNSDNTVQRSFSADTT